MWADTDFFFKEPIDYKSTICYWSFHFNKVLQIIPAAAYFFLFFWYFYRIFAYFFPPMCNSQSKWNILSTMANTVVIGMAIKSVFMLHPLAYLEQKNILFYLENKNNFFLMHRHGARILNIDIGFLASDNLHKKYENNTVRNDYWFVRNGHCCLVYE